MRRSAAARRPSITTGVALWLLLGASARVQAQAPAAAVTESATTSPEPPTLAAYLDAMVKGRLLVAEGASEAQLTALVAEGERLFLDGRYDAASALLLEAVESPRFADFHGFDSYAAAEHMAGSALYKLGSLKTARRYLERVIARGPRSPYYGPAVRRYVDVALQLGDLRAAAEWLARGERDLPQDARDELAYLRARAAQQAGDDTTAAGLLGAIGKRSRFHASAQYLLGVIDTRGKRYAKAEAHFCAVAGPHAKDHYDFYVDDRYFEVLDLARLALGRTAHERRRGEDAFYYYFQVPQDSPRLTSALFEAAWASYEAEDHDTAIDLLEQLDARYPESPYADEAAVLRGYVSLARCDFSPADKHFVRFARRFAPLADEIERLLENPVRREALYEDLLAAEGGSRARDAQRRTLLALLRVDPEFYRLHAQVKALDAEAARGGQLVRSIEAVRARLRRGDKPSPAQARAPEEGDAVQLDRNVELAFTMARSLGEQLDALRAAGAPQAKLAAVEQALAELSLRVVDLANRTQGLRAEVDEPPPDAAQSAQAGGALQGLLARDAALARALPGKVAAVRAKLVRAANEIALQALQQLHTRVRGLLRSAGIGRIDAVMGSKRRIEAQIESLAAGRFPPELRDPLLVQGLLADDEEYWPFEGEDWPDEYEEHYDTRDKGKGKAAAEASATSPGVGATQGSLNVDAGAGVELEGGAK